MTMKERAFYGWVKDSSAKNRAFRGWIKSVEIAIKDILAFWPGF